MSKNDFRVSSEWYNRPSDQRFVNLHDMHAACLQSAENGDVRIIDSDKVKVIADNDNPELLRMILPPENGGQQEVLVKPSHWSFGQTCGLVQAPASYLRKLPAKLAAINLQYGLMQHRAEKMKSYSTINGDSYLRALTGPDYGRIYDHEVVNTLRRIAGNGIGDTHWKVPGIWGKPLAEVTKENTTLYASDRDMFVFLVDEEHPIVIGKLPNGEDDIVFRGFYVWNSEVGNTSFGIATFLYRTVCQNRIIWGQSHYQELTFRHSKGAPDRFVATAMPALEQYAQEGTDLILRGINNAKQAVVATNDESRETYLENRGFSKTMTKQILDRVLEEEKKPAESVWDFVQGITAVARDVGHQDARVALELKASALMKKVA